MLKGKVMAGQGNTNSQASSRVSIGLPVYNGEAYLAKTLDSLLAQTFTDTQIIVGDNASTDATKQICLEYAEKDSRVVYLPSDKNLGAAWNYNRVFREATGEYFRWAAADDLWAREYDAACVEVLDNNPSAVLCYAKVTNIDSDDNEIEKFNEALCLDDEKASQRFRRFQDRFRKETSCSPVFGLIRTKALAKTPLIGHYVDSDRNLLMELLLVGKFHEIPEYYLFRRIHEKSSYLANATTTDRAKWFDPKLTSDRQFKRWKWLMEHLRSIRRVHLDPIEKLRCYSLMVRWSWWHRRKLFREARNASKLKIRRAIGLSRDVQPQSN